MRNSEKEILLWDLEHLDTDNIYQAINDLRNVLIKLVEEVEVPSVD